MNKSLLGTKFIWSLNSQNGHLQWSTTDIIIDLVHTWRQWMECDIPCQFKVWIEHIIDYILHTKNQNARNGTEVNSSNFNLTFISMCVLHNFMGLH